MSMREHVLSKAMGFFLIAATIAGSWPGTAVADPPRTRAETPEVKGPKKTKRKRSWTAHGFTGWTRRLHGTAFAALPKGAYRTPAEIAVATARAQIGKPYRWGGVGPSSFDCSGLTRFAWAAAGVHLPHSSRGQYASLHPVPIDELRPGDILYRPGHVGLYVGKGRMVHAPQAGYRVQISPLGRVVGAGRPE